MRVRAAHRGDVDAIAGLFLAGLGDAASATFAVDELGGEPPDFVRDIIKAASRREQLLLVAEVASRGWIAAGFLRIVPRLFARAAHVASVELLVAPAWRGQGVGAQLLETAPLLAGMLDGVERLEIHVAEDDDALRHLVERLGWRRLRQEPGALARGPKRIALLLYAIDR